MFRIQRAAFSSWPGARDAPGAFNCNLEPRTKPYTGCPEALLVALFVSLLVWFIQINSGVAMYTVL